MIHAPTTWTREKLLDWFKSNQHGIVCFCGDTCSSCKRTANVPEMGGWYCACGHYNVLLFAGHNRPMYERPDHGPSRALVVDAMRASGVLRA